MSLDKRIDRLGREQKASIVYEIHNSCINIETREIFLHGDNGEHDEDPGIDWRSATAFVKNIRLLESFSKDKVIFVHQYTYGGEWCSGMAIYDSIQACQAPVIFVMWGVACSMGSVIPQAADRRVIAPNCGFMIHEGSSSLEGTHKQVMSGAEVESKTKKILFDIYVDVCQYGPFFEEGEYSQEDIKNFLQNKMDKKEDWWLDAQETVKYGFADGVLGYEGFETLIDIKNNWLDSEEE